MKPFWDANPVAEMPSEEDGISQEEKWHRNSLIVWGGLRPGGAVTCHLPSSIERWSGTHAGRAACMPNMGILVVWTVEFGYDEWRGGTLCRRCFDKNGRPKTRWMPKGGWFYYRRKPKDEQLLYGGAEEEKRATAVRRILDMPREPIDEGDGVRRIVEV